MDITWLKEAFQQAYVYIPTILAFISAVGIPSLVKIGQIVSNSKAYLQSAKTLKDVVNGVTNTFQQIIDTILIDYEQELAELEMERAITINKKMKELLDLKIARVKECIEKYKNMSVAELIEKVGNIEVTKKRVKIKVVKKDKKEAE